MKEIFARCASPEDYREMTALAFYMQAVMVKERQHMPAIGPTVDRRILKILSRIANSTTNDSLVCVACAQIHTHVRFWDQRESGGKDHEDCLIPEIRKYKVLGCPYTLSKTHRSTLLGARSKNSKIPDFLLGFSLRSPHFFVALVFACRLSHVQVAMYVVFAFQFSSCRFCY